jgi:hypothetical protein
MLNITILLILHLLFIRIITLLNNFIILIISWVRWLVQKNPLNNNNLSKFIITKDFFFKILIVFNNPINNTPKLSKLLLIMLIHM